ncbi:hypothetical protein UVI_02058650 [Ustilaginoidea virens]|uniref:Uncharacterized protein n=1 Tax=Ustilaginoidea virens TaxID=1159556 RepID=A0A1B5L5A5_USTVR|nr:hypothetical protein UVI_02058650 [Ustilaginoidea virens]
MLMMDPANVAAQSVHMRLHSFGLDPLNAIGMRNWIGRELQAHLQIRELLTVGVGEVAGFAAMGHGAGEDSAGGNKAACATACRDDRGSGPQAKLSRGHSAPDGLKDVG